jgi:gas vesicle protein
LLEYTEICKGSASQAHKEVGMDDDKRFSYFFLGLGIGVAVGILFAPKSGEETREFIKGKAEEGKEFLKRRSVELRDQTTDIIDRGKQAVTSKKEQLAAAVEAGRQAYRDTLKDSSAAGLPDDYVEGV